MNELILILITALITAYITTKVQGYFDKKRKQEDVLFEIYMKLMELSSWQFWLASAQIRNREEPKDVAQKVSSLKWQIADASRKLEAEELEDVLKVLFIEKFSHYERYEKLSGIIDRVGYKVNPKYKKTMQSIEKENLKNHVKELENKN